MNKYGDDQFSFEVIYQSKDKDHTHKVMEPLFIAEYNSIETGYNITPGGEGTFGRVITDEMRANLSSKLKGRKMSETQYANYITSKANNPNPWIGRRHTDEAKAKISAVQTGRKLSEETKSRMSASHVGKAKTDETKARMSAAQAHDWIVTHPDGREEAVTNMRQFCIDNNLNAGKMTLVSQGKRLQHKGYKCRKQ
jgi:group I intron endonuclease